MGIFEQIKKAVTAKDIIERFHAKANKANKVCCPFHHEKTASLSIDTKEEMWKCFGCGVGGDGIRFLAKLKGIEDYEAAKLIIKEFRLNIDYEKEFAKTPQGEMRAYIREAQTNISQTDYFKQRGLTDATIKAFGLGYDPKEKAVVIPYSPAQVYYQRRSLKARTFYKPVGKIFGQEPLWHPQLLELKDKTPVFVVESPICAMSIAQYGGTAVALCGTSNVKKFVEGAKKLKPRGTLVIALDNDEPGRIAQKELITALKEAKIKHIEFNVAGSCADPNELLLKSANQLCKNIAEGIKQAKVASLERTDLIDLDELCDMGIPPKRFIVEKMIPEDSLCMLVAASKVGKSWWVLQLALSVTRGLDFMGEKTNKCSVVYYALEDSHQRLTERRNSLNKSLPMPADRARIQVMLESKNIENGLLEDLEQLKRKDSNIKLIIIDTFQIIRGTPRRNEGAYAWDYRECAQLRKFSADNNVTLLIVHHARKQEDDGDVFNMISGSMAIMGASDATFFISKKKRMDENESYKFSQTGRDVYQAEVLIEKSKDGLWTKIANAEEQTKKREEDAFKNSRVVQLILKLLERQPSGWCGTTKDFVKEGITIFSEHIGTEIEVGKEINRIEMELFRRHKINHITKRSSKGNKHEFKPHSPYSLFDYTK